MNYPYLQQQQYYNRTAPQLNWSNQQIRPVSSIEEVRAAQIDFDGSIFYFPDIGNKRIYTKSINLDGTVSINLYELTQIPTDQFNGSSYVTQEEFKKVVNNLLEMFNNKQQQEIPQTAAQPAFNF